MVPAIIAGCQVDEKEMFLFDGIKDAKVEICPGCFKLAPYGNDTDHIRFLEYDEEVYPKEHYFQKESTFKHHLSTCINGFDVNSNSDIFEILTPKQKRMVHILGKFSQTAQGLDSAMIDEHKFTLGNFRAFVSTYDFKKGDRLKKIPIGYISVMMKDNEELKRKIPVIEDIFVFKKFRRNGIASKLLDHVIHEYNITTDIGVQLKISPEFESLLKKRFKYIWGCLGFCGKKIFL